MAVVVVVRHWRVIPIWGWIWLEGNLNKAWRWIFGLGNVIPASNQTIQSAGIATITGAGPINSIGYPIQLPTSTAKIFSASANTGRGQFTETFNLQFLVPPDAFAGTYTTALTVSLVSGL